jgi:hypothetical protein
MVVCPDCGKTWRCRSKGLKVLQLENLPSEMRVLWTGKEMKFDARGLKLAKQGNSGLRGPVTRPVFPKVKETRHKGNHIQTTARSK